MEVYVEDKKLVTFRDSLKLIPGSLASLGESLCPELGAKGGEVDHSTVCISNIGKRKDELIEYMKQDICLVV